MSPLSGALWPAHPKPLPDELLSSWIVRIARGNGLKLQTFCDHVFGKERQLWNRDIDRLAPAWLLASVARHSGTSPDDARRTTLDVYRGRLFHENKHSGQLRWILPIGVYHRTRRRFGLQFCPQCLIEDTEPYFRTLWRVAMLTFCDTHQLHLHDRCPACGSPIAFHRRELGRPKVTDSGPLYLCHHCDGDLRDAECKPFIPYEDGIGTTLAQLKDCASGGDGSLNIDHVDVLHQLCKILVGTRNSSRLATHVAKAIESENIIIRCGRQAFESRPVDQRTHVVQLASWLLADLPDRIPAAWRAKAVRYNTLRRDFPSPPAWYRFIIDPLNRGW